ncbi:MAG: hypothetical protein IJD48_02440 [Clostridia bacterium]|nr:hypothetical protein [Clostridia bacterium]
MEKKKLIIDFDDTICQSVFLKKVNEFLGTNYSIDDFKDYLIDEIIPESQKKKFYNSFFDVDPYEDLDLIDGAKKALKKLNEVYDIYICSAGVMLLNPQNSGKLFASKYNYLLKRLPFLDPKKFIFTSSKELIKGDVIIDDYFHNLRSDIKTKLLFTSYHNKDFTDEELKKRGVERVNSWEEICKKLL